MKIMSLNEKKMAMIQYSKQLYKTLRKINLTCTKLLEVEEGWSYPRFTYLTYKVKSINLLEPCASQTALRLPASDL